MEKIVNATHHGALDINGISVTCAVLEDGSRVISERSVANALGAEGSGGYWQKRKKGAVLPRYLYGNFLEPYISEELKEKLSQSITYKATNGSPATGFPAELLPQICDVWIKAGENGAVPEARLNIPKTAYTLLKGFATVGIIALVDEATGYQYDREKDELQKILEAYISEEILNWQLTFTNAFYKEIFRLKGWDYTPNNIKNRPGVVGKYTNQFVYEMLPKGVLQKIKQKTPKSEAGNYIYRFHQSLTPDTGRDHLKNQILVVTTLMSISRSWEEFLTLFQRKFGQLSLDFDTAESEEKKEIPKTNFDKNLKGLLNVPPPKKDGK